MGGLGEVAEVLQKFGMSTVMDAIHGLPEGEDDSPVVARARQWATTLAASCPAPPPGSGGLQRLVAYVCCLPRWKATPEALEERCQAAALGHTLSHWPNRCQMLTEGPGPCARNSFAELER